MKGYFRKMPGGMLAPNDDDTAEWLSTKVKTGAIVSGEFKQPRNYKFLQKTMVLFNYCFDHFAERMGEVGLEYKGQQAAPSKDRFRKDLTILAGHYTVTYDIMGNIKLEAKSLSYANCSEAEAERIYSDVINAALKHVVTVGFTEQELRDTVDGLLRFA
jgi:hypothetical protein